MRRRFIPVVVTMLWLIVIGGPIPRVEAQQNKPAQKMLAAAVRHEILTLPYYDVFDWLEAELLPNGGVALGGQVVRPITASDASIAFGGLKA